MRITKNYKIFEDDLQCFYKSVQRLCEIFNVKYVSETLRINQKTLFERRISYTIIVYLEGEQFGVEKILNALEIE